MYSDPSLIREHNVKLSFNDLEADLINAWVNYSGQQKAAFLREMLLNQARLDIEAQMAGNEGPQRSLFGN
jgi:hypothetical protein